jgi:hypothetical protein
MSMNKIVKSGFGECKRYNANIEDSDWRSSKAQLERFIGRWEEGNPSQVIYGLVCIGHWTPGALLLHASVQGHIGGFQNGGSGFSIKDNATDVDMILGQWRVPSEATRGRIDSSG